ncbi:MAG: Trk system potassium transporter TrkA [Muribaculaceae bacterium]|nr:Trk system potassium transporter TrkA [Muribaculaceae bacterium]
MKIVIAGAGEVGSHLAKLFSNEDQDITLLDNDSVRLGIMDSNYNLMPGEGDPTSFGALREANAGKCDLFIAVTPYQTNNIVACSIAKNLGARMTVARIDTYDYMQPDNLPYVHALGVDRVIYPEQLAAQEILQSLRRTWMRNWFELHDGRLILVGVRVNQSSPLEGMQLRDFTYKNHHFHVSAINRFHRTIIPRGNDTMEAGDVLYITTTKEHVDELIPLTGNEEYTVKRVLVVGGTKIARRLINLADDEFRFKVIETDRSVCRKLAKKCSEVDIVNGDARDSEFLSEIGIEDMDALVALTDSSETNIFSCLMARDLGVKKTVADVENIQFLAQAEKLNVGTIVNKKLLASSYIFQLLLDQDSSTSKSLALTDAEVAELEVRPNSKITRSAVKDLELSRDMTLAGLFRDGEGMLISGNTRMQAGDKVLVFCLAGALNKVERLFNS